MTTASPTPASPAVAPASEVPHELLRGLSHVGLLAAATNVIMQLSRPQVGYGVVESKVDSGNLYKHPIKRTRTTLTYIAVATLGSEEDKQVYRKAVNRSHAQVHSGPDSPVQYNAFDKELQLWVAACLYKGFEDIALVAYGTLGPRADTFYQQGAVLGTTLQVPRAMWPKDRAAFEQYWQDNLAKAVVDDRVREYLTGVARGTFLPWPIPVLFGPIRRLYTTGFLPPHFREQMRMPWGKRQQALFDASLRVLGLTHRLSPEFVRLLPYRVLIWDMRRRVRKGVTPV